MGTRPWIRKWKRDDLEWGFRWGVSLAAVYSAYVVGLGVAQWSIEFPGYNANLFEIVLAYFVGGAICGTIVGALRSLGESNVGAAILGIVAGGPVWFALGVSMRGNPLHWQREDWIVWLICTIVVGPFFGLVTRAKR